MAAATDEPAEASAPTKEELARISNAELARTIVQNGKIGVLSTKSKLFEGHPLGSVVAYAADQSGRPVFSFSTLSLHTKDIAKDEKVSITVTASDFKGMNDARTTVIGSVSKVKPEEEEEVRASFLAKHPDAFWVDFGDFSFWRLDTIVGAHLNGGFARAQTLSAAAYLDAVPDPVAPFAAPIMGHMNADHEDAIVAYVKHYAGIAADGAQMRAVDRLGMDITVKKGDESFPVRVAFIRPVLGRKDIKDVMVEMSKTAAQALSAAKPASE